MRSKQTVEDFTTSFLVMCRTARQKINKETEDLNNMINQRTSTQQQQNTYILFKYSEGNLGNSKYMEIKQNNPKQPMGQRKTHKRN